MGGKEKGKENVYVNFRNFFRGGEGEEEEEEEERREKKEESNSAWDSE
jgi:hypothetical protein